MSAVPAAVAKHGIAGVVDNIPEGFEVDGSELVKWLMFDFGKEIRHELGRRCCLYYTPTGKVLSEKPRREAVVKPQKRLSDDEEAQLLALLEKQAGRG